MDLKVNYQGIDHSSVTVLDICLKKYLVQVNNQHTFFT